MEKVEIHSKVQQMKTVEDLADLLNAIKRDEFRTRLYDDGNDTPNNEKWGHGNAPIFYVHRDVTNKKNDNRLSVVIWQLCCFIDFKKEADVCVQFRLEPTCYNLYFQFYNAN